MPSLGSVVRVWAQNCEFMFYFLWIYLNGKDSGRARAKSLILHTSVLCTPFSHMNVNGNGSQSKYLDNGLSRLEFIEYATLLLTLTRIAILMMVMNISIALSLYIKESSRATT